MKTFIKFLFFILCLRLFTVPAYATSFSDLEFGRYQFSDTQWNVSACLYSTTCQVYSLSGIGTSWNTGSPYHISSTQYIGFVASNNPSYPWEMKVYNSNGTVAADLGAGKLAVEGTDSFGHHFFFFINANLNGTVFSTDYGFPNSSGFSFTGTQSPTVAQTNTFAASGSSAPLSAGQTYTSTPTYPAATITVTEQNDMNQTLTTGHNLVYIQQSGGTNTSVTVTQTGDYNIFNATIGGSYHAITATQTGNYNYENSVISGASNTINNTQDGNKSLFQNVSGSNNNITTTQTGGNHFLELNIPTNGNTVSVTQAGAAQKLFSLTINSANVGVTVVQDNATTADSASMSITCTSGPCTGYSYVKH